MTKKQALNYLRSSGMSKEQIQAVVGALSNSEKQNKSTTKNDLGVDAVSRKAVINQIFYSTDNNGDVVLGSVLRERIARLPSVTPQEPKTGHWIVEIWNNREHHTCSECNRVVDYEPCYHYCPYCGVKMEEVEE